MVKSGKMKKGVLVRQDTLRHLHAHDILGAGLQTDQNLSLIHI